MICLSFFFQVYQANTALARSSQPEAVRFALVLEGCVCIKVDGWTLERIDVGQTFGYYVVQGCYVV